MVTVEWQKIVFSAKWSLFLDPITNVYIFVHDLAWQRPNAHAQSPCVRM